MGMFSKKHVSEMFGLPTDSEEDARNRQTNRDLAGSTLSFAKQAAMARLQAAEIENFRRGTSDPSLSRNRKMFEAPPEREDSYPGEIFPDWNFD